MEASDKENRQEGAKSILKKPLSKLPKGVQVSRQQLLNRLAKELSISLSFSARIVYTKLNKYSSQFRLSNLEIGGWSILLLSLSDHEKSISLSKVLLHTLYSTKKLLGTVEHKTTKRIERILPNFMLHYENWLLFTSCSFNLSLKRINSMLQKLKEPVHVPQKRGYFEDLVSFIMDKSETSNNYFLENELKVFEEETLDGERLSPIHNVYSNLYN